ncbi:MAG: hypothetical protein ACO34J_12060, partial [Prochlorothrix sp.]
PNLAGLTKSLGCIQLPIGKGPEYHPGLGDPTPTVVDCDSEGASHFRRILVGVVPPWLSSSAQNQGNHGGFAPTRSVKSLKWNAPDSDPGGGTIDRLGQVR